MYGSSLMQVTLRPRASSRQPIEDAAKPFPKLDTTPPVTKIYLGIVSLFVLRLQTLIFRDWRFDTVAVVAITLLLRVVIKASLQVPLNFDGLDSLRVK